MFPPLCCLLGSDTMEMLGEYIAVIMTAIGAGVGIANLLSD